MSGHPRIAHRGAGWLGEMSGTTRRALPDGSRNPQATPLPDGLPTESGHLDPERFREVFGEMPSGVSVITTAGLNGPRGMTASAVCSLSLEPMLVLVCIHSGSATLQSLIENGRFAVNVLQDTQAFVSRVFAGRQPPAEKFASVPHCLIEGSPVLDEALAWLTCTLHMVLPGGDHTIVVGAVTGMGRTGGQPLVRYAGQYRQLGSEVA
jgi:flavin reductase (DIM6/NTAB) family NADH-FMN oxidoreductase RutF